MGLAMGDVTGKGLQAAVHTAMARHFLRAYAYEEDDPSSVITRLDAALHAFTPEEVFVSLAYATLDPANGELRFVNAGHEAPLLLAATGVCTRLPSHSMVLGIQPGGTCRVQDAQLQPGDVLLFYTDGATDGWDHVGIRGSDRLEQILRQVAEKPARKIVHSLARALPSDTPSHGGDDVCFLALRRNAKR
jgi:sigma-B regulation protein RsbU (phosphoserine phosphatase)